MQVSKISFTKDASLVPQVFSTPDIVGNILHQLNVTTNSSILNTHDIPVIMRYAKNLSGTCQVLYRMIEEDVDFVATNTFLISLSNKYDKPLEYFAARFNTMPCKQWLFKFIEKEGYRNYYNAIQGIFKLAFDVSKEALKLDVKFNAVDCSHPSNTWYLTARKKTKQGMILTINTAPDSIVTPFGIVTIYNSDDFRHSGPIPKTFAWSISEYFIKRLNACFNRASANNSCIEIISRENFGALRMISEEDGRLVYGKDVETRIGNKNLIVNPLYYGFTIYNIEKVDGKPIPDVIEIEEGQKGCSKKLTSRMWSLLECERLGEISLVKQDGVKEAVIINPPLFQNIKEAAIWALDLAKKICNDGVKTDDTNRHTYKILAWKDKSKEALNEVKLMITLSNFPRPNPISEWSIGRVSRGKAGESFQLGYQTSMGQPFSFEELEEAYALAIKEVSKNWEISTLKENPLLLKNQKKSEEDYQLFVKKDATQNDTVLINLLAETMNLSKDIIPFVHKKEKFLWIKKKSLTEVCKAFNIETLI